MKIVVMTLGCKVNKYESDAMIYNLKLNGHEASDKLEKADAYIINTCAVTAEAEKKSRQMIARCRKFNSNAKIYVCGCASQKDAQQFAEKGVNFISGVAGKEKINDFLNQNGVNVDTLPTVYEEMVAQPQRIRAYIKIQDGCDNFCSYCIIPYLRGRSRSREIIKIIEEVASLGDEIKEVVLTGINVTDYRIDDQPGLLTLLEKLDPYGKRLRLSSMEETLVSEEFVKGLSELSNFCPHFHLSLQSGSASVLKRMNRKYTPEEFLASVELIRKYFPLAAITTDIIVGFPDESDDEFQQTYDFVQKVGFADIHIFQYSRREGTVAAKMKDLSPEVKQRRFEALNALKSVLCTRFIEQNIHGKVLVEEKVGKYYVGFTENYIKCYIKSFKNLFNQVVPVQIGKQYLDGVKAKVKKFGKNG